MNKTELDTARQQWGYFQRLRDKIGNLIKGTDDPEELQKLKERAAELRKREEYWKKQVEKQE
jgi:hypothetical protein